MTGKQKKLNSSLLGAVDKKDVVKAKKAISDGADANTLITGYPTEGWTPLFLAANRNDSACVEMLLEAGANINHKVKSESDAGATGATVLHALLIPGASADPRLLVRLLDAGAELDAATVGGETALGLAANYKNVACLNILLDRGSKAHLVEGRRITVLWQATLGENKLDVVKLLLDRGAPADAMSDFRMTPLMGACKAGDPAVAKLLLEHGASVHTINKRGLVPLHHACDYGDCCRSDEMRAAAIAVLELLLNAGAKADIRDNDGRTPLDYLEDEYALPVKEWLQLHTAKK